MRAVIVEARPERRLVVADVPEPDRTDFEVLVRVDAVSLNRGEVKTALTDSPDGYRPGTDYAGVVQAAAEDSGFKPGDRVAGLRPGGAWAERIAVPPFLLAPMPEGLSFAQAAALPTAGLTARYALDKGGPLKGKRVLVTGATGGVGVLAVQLAAQSGARVTALARSDSHAELLTKLGAHAVAVGEAEAAAAAPYDFIFESIGGALLGEALSWLASRGVCVLVGDAGGTTTTFNANRFRMGDGSGVFGGTTMYGFYLGEELWHAMPGPPLAALMAQVARGELDPVISVTAPWTDVQQVADDLIARRFQGKAVLTLD